MNKEELLRDLEEYSHFRKNWDGYGGDPVPKKILESSKTLIDRFSDKIYRLCPCSDGRMWFDLNPKEMDHTFVILIEKDTFQWAYMTPDYDPKKSIEIHDVPLDFDKIETLIKRYCE
jgi:hypothetical protein